VPKTLACLLAVLAWISAEVHAQRGTGELRLQVRDATGGAVSATGTLESDATHVRLAFTTDARGTYVAGDLPFGRYRLRVEGPGFAAFSSVVDVRSEVPQSYPIVLSVAPMTAAVTVSAAPGETLLDPYRPAAVEYLGAELLRDRPASAPGRSLIDLVNTQPGWLLEANGILHPRASEYQVQYVVDGIPLKDNRSPAFAQSLGIEQFHSMTVRTAGYPAEYGGKLGGVIEITSIRRAQEGFHGAVDAQAGSFGTMSAAFAGEYVRGRTIAGLSAESARTDRYLDPPVEANYTNDSVGRAIAGHVEHRWNDADRTRASVDRHHVGFNVPNEAIQEQAGQQQRRTADETLAQVTHDRVMSSDVFGSLRFMVRRTDASLTANALSTPIIPSQQRGFLEEYVNGSVAVHHGRHELKVGAEATFASIDEAFSSTIVAYRLGGARIFDGDVPAAFAFSARRSDREQSAYVQDLIRVGAATVSAGLRYDHYQLVVDEQAVSPRLAVSWYHAPANVVFHASYDRAFQTPAVENILLASSDLVKSLGGEGLSLPLRSSRGNFYEAGLSKALFNRVRVDANYFHRHSTNTADDEVLLNTGVSFPIAFAEGTVYGLETKLDVPRWGRVSGWVSYSLSKAVGRLPIAGGLFLGNDVAEQLSSTETFPITQDQRHTFRTRVRAQLHPRAWVAIAGTYNSGLPVETDSLASPAFLATQYGQAVLDRVDFDRGRVRPSSSLDLSFGADLKRSGNRSLRLQADVFNLTDRLNVINFAGLFSGTAIGAPRSGAIRLRFEF
jgi:TonB dependent receptor/Carboxypeptidase regulatory-like domain